MPCRILGESADYGKIKATMLLRLFLHIGRCFHEYIAQGVTALREVRLCQCERQEFHTTGFLQCRPYLALF